VAFDLATATPVESPKPGGFDLKTAQPARSATWVPDAAEPPIAQPTRVFGGPEDRAAIGRQVGLTARAGIMGLTSIPNMFGNAVGLKSSQAVSDALTKFGLPEPEGATERVAQDVAGGMAGAGGMAKASETVAKSGNALVQRVGQAMAERAGTQVVSGGAGGAAAGKTREAGGGPVAQLVAGVAGGAAPAVPALAEAAARAAMRGGEAGRQRMLQNIDTFEAAGAGTPTVGQATEGRGTRAIESTLSKVPGGAGQMAAKAEAEAAGLGTKVEDIAKNLSVNAGAAPAGRRIKSGLEQFVEDFKGSSGKLYDELDRHIPKQTPVEVSNTRDALAALNADIPGAPNLSKWFKNSKIQGIEGSLKADTSGQAAAEQSMNPFQLGMLKTLPMTDAERAGMFNAFTEGKLPYEALKKLRTLVGNEISDSTIASDVPRSKWKPLYAALSKDMGAAAQEAGPKAEAAFVRANNYHRAGMTRLDDVLGPILKKGDPEDVFKAALSGTQEGATTINGVMKSLPVESRKAVAATMLQRLGKATPGKQNDTGEAFSTETFLTNWNKLHPDSKRVLFSTLPDGMRGDLDKIATVASNVRDGSKVFANPSGTTQASASTVTAGAFVVSLLTGQLRTAGAIAGVSGAANVGARVMTNPKVVHWLAETTKGPMEQLPAQLNVLFQQSLYMKGEERRDVRQFIKDVREARTAAGQQTAPIEAVPQ
jgi:hypothetical protein